jgi:hypothetical protein
MAKAISLIFLLALTACSGVPQGQYTTTPCTGNEASKECQAYRYERAF